VASESTSSGNTDNNPVTNRDGGIAALFVRRPVLAVVLNLLIVIGGIAALFGIEVREMPNVDRPVVTVRTNYSGATPETIDKEITAVIEGAVARTPGVVSIASQSRAGQSRVTIQFDVNTDINVAANDLRDAIGRLRSLPDDADTPQIIKADADSTSIVQLAATSATMSIQDLTQFVDDRVIPRLAAVSGVADVQEFGDRNPLVQIIFDPDALAARKLTVADLSNALGSVAFDAPAGSLSDTYRTLLVRADAAAKSAAEISNIQVNPTTKVSDVADVVFGPADRVTSLRIDGKTGLGLGIVRQAGANTLDVSKAVHAAVAELQQTLPPGVDLKVTTDDAEYIGGAITEVLRTLLLATSIVVVVIYVFLRSVRVTFIPAVTVPIALTGTLAAMWVMGFSINMLTLLALVLATGLVVDDAIVVIENISRQRGLGLGPRAAAVIGTRQVFFAVIATTATLAAVFIPISFLPGLVGSLFSEFGFVLAFAVILSSVVALSLTPMLASRLISDREIRHGHNAVGRAVIALGEAAVRLYARLLEAALRAPVVVVVAALLFAGAAVIGFGLLPSELAPSEDRGVVSVSVDAPQGSTIDYADTQLRQIEQAAIPFLRDGEATGMFSMARGSGSGFMFLRLAPWNKRVHTQDEISAELNRRLEGIPGVQAFSRSTNGLHIRGGGQGLTFAVVGNDYDALVTAADKLVGVMEQNPAFGNVRLSYDTTQAQLSIKINRQRASDIGIPIATISSAVQTLLDGRNLGNFYVGDNPIEIRLKAPAGMIQDTNALDNIQLRAGDGKMVPLSTLVSFKESAVAPSLPRQDQRRAIPVRASLGDGVDLRAAMNTVEAMAAKALPANMSIVYTGDAKELNNNSSGVSRTFVFALIVVVLVLAAQFESFTSALILIATVPFGLAAAAFAMLLTGGSVNIYSEIGLVMLVGLMAKNGILIVEFANQLRDAGQSIHDAIRNASLIRLRPVVMTMISTVVGGLPLVLLAGPGSAARHALGWVVVGGLGFATVATLFLTPVVFSLLARFSSPRVTEEKRLARELEAAAAAPGSFTPTAEETGEMPAFPAAAE
jgi:HAE1 family hydrophobic/amphiphilic exporter-1